MSFSPENVETKIKYRYKKFFLLFLLCASSGLVAFFGPANTLAATGINKQISFQGKVVNNDGTNVSNGNYDFVFKLYTVSSAGSPVWTETRTGGNQVAVTDGIFQVNLGSVTSLPGSIDFNTDNIYLGIEFNSDGEMSPRVHFTAAPYAFNAKTVGGLTVTDTTGTLTIPSGKTISFADAFTTSGSFATTLTATGTTNVTLPTTGTLATLAGTESFTNKTIGSTGLVFSGASTDITTASGESLVLSGAGAGTIDLQDATNVDSLTTDTGGVSIAASQAYTGTGAVTLSSGGSSGLTLDSASGRVGVATGDFLSVIVSGVSGAAAGDIWYDSAAQKFKINENGTTKTLCNTTDLSCGSGGVTADSLDFTELEDTLDLDAALTLNQTTNTWSQTFTGTTTTGLTYTANSLTSGKALAITSSATAFTGSLLDVTLSGSNSANTGSLLAINNTGTSNTNTALYIKHYATGTNNLAFRIDDVSGDTTPFVIDGNGWVGIGTSTPTGPLQVEGGAAAADTTGADITINAQDGTGPSGQSGGNVIITPGDGAGGYASGYIDLGPASQIYMTRSGNDSYTTTGTSFNDQAPSGTSLTITNGYTFDSTGSLTDFSVRNASGNHQAAYLGAVSVTGAGVYTPAFVFGQSTNSSDWAERMRLDENGRLGIGDASPASLLTVGSGDAFQVNSSGAIVAATGITSSGTITFSGFSSNGGPLYTNGSGVLAQVTAGTSSQVLHGGTTPSFSAIVAGDITADSLDFTEFQDTLDLDAALTLNQTTNTWSQTFTGTTTTGFSYAANSLTSGTAFSINSSATAFTGSLLDVTLSGSNSANTGSLLAINNTGTSNTNTALYIKHYATGTNNLAFRIDDVSGDTTPFVVDGNGWLGLGVSSPSGPLDIEPADAPADTTGANVTIKAQNSTGPTPSQGGNISIVPGNGAGGYGSGYIELGPMSTAMYITRNGGDAYTSTGSGQNPGGITLVTSNNWSVDDNGSIHSYGVQNTNGNHQNAFIGSVSITGAGVYTPALVFGQSTGSNSYAERMRLDENGRFGIGDLSPASLLTVGSGDLFQVNSSGQIAAAAGITSSGTITFSGLSSAGIVTNTSGGVLGTTATVPVANGGTNIASYAVGDILYASGSTTLSKLADVATGSVLLSGGVTTAPAWGQITASHVTADTLDFSEFQDTLDLDAALTLNQTTNTWSQTFTGTTTTGFSYAANSLTSGTAFSVNSSATAFTGSLADITLSGSNSANTGSLLAINNTGTSNTNTALYIKHYATGTNNLAFRIDDVSGDTTPFVVDGTGAVGIGTTAPASMLETYGTGSADPVTTLTAPDATYDPTLKFRTGSTPAVQFTLGVDNSDSDKFKIYSGDGLGSGDEFVIDSNGVTTIANLNLGATSFDTDAGIVSWTDLQVSATPAANTVESYSAQIDGNSFLTIYAEADGSGGLTTTTSAVKADVQLDATADGLVTKVNAGNCSDATFNRDTDGTLCVDSSTGRFYYRYSGAWHYAAQTAGFQIPNYETAPKKEWTEKAKEEQENALPFDSSNYPEYLTERLKPGEFLIPYVDEYLDDGAVHGLYARFEDVKGKLFKDEQTQITQLTLQTNQNINSLAELQVSVDDQLIVVGNSLNELKAKDTALEAKLAEHDSYFVSDQSRIAGLESLAAQLSLDINAQGSRTTLLEAELGTLTEQVNTLTEFFTTLNLDKFVAKDEEGNVALEGRLKAKILETGALAIEVVDPDAPTIGTAAITPVEVDEDHDGKDDVTGADGESVEVMTKAMIPMVKGSRIFTSFKNNPKAFSWVEKIRDEDGEYVGFKIRLSEKVTEETKLDWWLVEQKDENNP